MLELLIIVGFIGASGFGYVALRGIARPRGAADLQMKLVALDTEAFLNLIDPAEDAFLKTRLPARSYRIVRRMRIRASMAYLAQASANARMLMAYAERAMASRDVEAAARARALAASAIQFQLLALQAKSRLCLAWLVPSTDLMAVDLIARYEQLRYRLMRTVAIGAPASSARIAAGL
jgi:hypothetical protein